MDQCPICVENYTASTRRRLVCNYCQQAACRVCVEYFLLNTLEDATCMHCRKPWTREDLVTIGLTKTWVNVDYKVHRQQMLLERERANLPDAQAEIERQSARLKEIERLEGLIADTVAQRERYKAQIRVIQDQIRQLPSRSRTNPEVIRLRAQIDALEQQMFDSANTANAYREHIAIVKGSEWQPGQALPSVTINRGTSLVVKGLMRTGLSRAEAMAVAAETDLSTVEGLTPSGEGVNDNSATGVFQSNTTDPTTDITDALATVTLTAGVTAVTTREDHSTTNPNPAAKARFIKPCPGNDCRGFLSTRWKCGVCQRWVCKDCWEIKGLAEDTPHQCKAETLASVADIKASTVNCPACGTAVYRSHGCNTMFCTHCKTGFNYATRKIIEAKTVGNPHFYEWRAQQRGAGGVNDASFTRPAEQGECCERLIDIDIILTTLKTIEHTTRQQLITVFREIYHQVEHLENVTLVKYRAAEPDANLDLNVSYLRKIISEKDWKIKLQQRHKQQERNAAFREIINMVIGVSHDLLDKFRTKLTLSQIAEIIGEFLELEKYALRQLERIKKLYDSSAEVRLDFFHFNPQTRRRAVMLHQTKGLGTPDEPEIVQFPQWQPRPGPVPVPGPPGPPISTTTFRPDMFATLDTPVRQPNFGVRPAFAEPRPPTRLPGRPPSESRPHLAPNPFALKVKELLG